MMKRRTVLRRAGLGSVALLSAGLAGCSSSNDDGDTGTLELPGQEVSALELDSGVDNLSIVDHEVEFTRGQRHEDIHFAVTPTIENTGDQTVDLGDYSYELVLYDPEANDITPSDTWALDSDEVAPGETGTVLLQVSFIDSDTPPETVDSFDINFTCGGSDAAYC